MGLFAVNPRVWLVFGLLFLAGLVRRLWKQWRQQRAGQLTKRP